MRGYLKSSWDESIAKGEPYPNKIPFTVLHGSWEEMGKQYGKFQAKYIRIVFDALYSLWAKAGIRNSSLESAIAKFAEISRLYTPEMVSFIDGISDGASGELDKAIYSNALSNFDKVFFINSLFELAIPSSWEFLAELTGEKLETETVEFIKSLQRSNDASFASHAWAAWGKATRSGGCLAGGARDQPWFPLLYSCAYVAIPEDDDAKITFVNTISGVIAASSQLNEKGVYVSNTIVENTWNPIARIREKDVGVPALIATAHVSFFAETTSEAARMITTGGVGFKSTEGRKTFPYTVGFNQLFADRDHALVVERTAHHYYVRSAGMSGEIGDYLVLTNHNIGKMSNTQDGESIDPMGKFGAGESFDNSSASRYWSLYHLLANQLGKIDLEFGIEELEKMKQIFTKDGDKLDSISGIPVWKLGLSPERFLFRNPRDEAEFPYGGSLTTTVADLDNLDVYFVLGIPDYWDGPWQHVSLADPSYNMIRKRV